MRLFDVAGAFVQHVFTWNGFAQNPREPTDVSVFVVQCSQAGELVPPSEAISQEQLDAIRVQ